MEQKNPKGSNPVDPSTPKRRYKFTVRSDKDPKKKEDTLLSPLLIEQINDPALRHAAIVSYINMTLRSIEKTRESLETLKEIIAKMGIK